MTDLQDYRARMQDENQEHDVALRKMKDENEAMKAMLREWAEPPHAYGKKRELLDRTLLLVEGWE